MKIQFSCSCGKSYEAADSFAGQSILCKSCQQPVQIPTVTAQQTTSPPSAPVPVAPIPSAPYPVAHHPSAQVPDPNYFPPSASSAGRKPPGRKPVAYSAKAQQLLAEHARNERGQGFSAANPGLLRPNLLTYFFNFPHRIMWRVGLLMVFTGLSFLHWIAIPLVLVMAWYTFRYVREIRGQFVSGCICPATILSVDPPVVAVYTDTSMGVNSCKLIRLFEQPLHRLPPMFAKSGRTSTICYFFGMYPGLSEHFFTVLPTMPHFVSGDQFELQRIFDSISDEEWQGLEMGLRQLPPNPELRSYRIVRPDFQPRLAFSSSDQLGFLARKFLADANGKFGNEITDEDLAKASKTLPQPLDRSHVVALCKGFGAGIVVMSGGLVYFFRDENKQPISIGWNEIKVAYGNFEATEIIETNHQRLLVPNECGMELMVQMEKFINAAVGLGPND